MAADTPLTDRQLALLGALHDLSRGGVVPTYRELGAAIGMRSSATVWEHVEVLRARGYLELPRQAAPRALRLTNKGLQAIGVEPTVEVPRDMLYHAYHALELQPIQGSWHRDDKRVRDRVQRHLRRLLKLVYRCESCGDWLAEEDLSGEGHVVTVADGDGNPTPELCGPVRMAGEEAV